jgi:orotidine-5'-phosphate decarboxylase
VAQTFADRLLHAIRAKGAPVCIGIDPVYDNLPAEITEHPEFNDAGDSEVGVDAVLEFCRRIIRIVAPFVPAVKINSAFFERYYSEGIDGYYQLIQEAAEKDLIVIGDVKRGDVGHTAELYAAAHLADPSFDNLDELVGPDAVTLSPYLGFDAVKPFLDVARSDQKGVFILVKTTNPSAGEIQDLVGPDGSTVAEHVARHVAQWGSDPSLIGECGYSAVGAVVSPKDPTTAAKLRALMPQAVFLVPGYGAQGASAADVAACFKPDGTGALVSASRSIIYAYENMKYLEMYASEWEKCVEQACKDFVADLKKVSAPR